MPQLDPATGYVISNGFYYPSGPKEYVLRLLGRQPVGTALDLGAGFGNNAEVLLESGYTVTATDTNPDCLDALAKLAQRYPGRLRVVDTPLEQYVPTESYDAVIATMVLQFLKPADALVAITMMRQHTNPGGYNVILNYTTDNHLPSMGPLFKSLINVPVLLLLYTGWDIVEFDQVDSRYQGYGMVRMLARRPLF